MTYIIADKVNEPNAIHHVEDRQMAEDLVKKITDQIREMLNHEFVTITRKEDDITVKWQGELMMKMLIREDDEVDVTDLNE